MIKVVDLSVIKGKRHHWTADFDTVAAALEMVVIGSGVVVVAAVVVVVARDWNSAVERKKNEKCFTLKRSLYKSFG